MRGRRLPVLGAATAAALFFAASASAQSDAPWLHVQVEGENDEAKVEINLPLAAVEALSESMGEKALQSAFEHADESSQPDVELEDLRAFWQALRAEPGAWVTIDDDDGGLRARMDGDEVRITAEGDDGSVNIRFPSALGDALFSGPGPDPDFAGAIRSLADHDGDLVVVDGGDGKVRIWIGPQ